MCPQWGFFKIATGTSVGSGVVDRERDAEMAESNMMTRLIVYIAAAGFTLDMGAPMTSESRIGTHSFRGKTCG
jgi:hypothetical protein